MTDKISLRSATLETPVVDASRLLSCWWLVPQAFCILHVVTIDRFKFLVYAIWNPERGEKYII